MSQPATRLPGPSARLLDVSSYQPAANWHAVRAAGVVGVYIRAKEGATTDTSFAEHRAAARDAGLVTGAYQFLRARHPGAEQAEQLLELTGGLLEGEMPCALDVELGDGHTPAEVAQAIADWVAVIEPAIGRPPVIYAGPGPWAQYVGNSRAFGRLPLWCANYADRHTMPAGWSDWLIWQVTDKGRVDGLVGNVDLNVFHGDDRDFQAWVAGGWPTSATDTDPDPIDTSSGVSRS